MSNPIESERPQSQPQENPLTETGGRSQIFGEIPDLLLEIAQGRGGKADWLAKKRFLSIFGTPNEAESAKREVSEALGSTDIDVRDVRRRLGVYELRLHFLDFDTSDPSINRSFAKDAVDMLHALRDIDSSSELPRRFQRILDSGGPSSQPTTIQTSVARMIVSGTDYSDTARSSAIETLRNSGIPVNRFYADMAEKGHIDDAQAANLFRELIFARNFIDAAELIHIVSEPLAEQLCEQFQQLPFARLDIESQRAIAIALAPYKPETAFSLYQNINNTYLDEASGWEQSVRYQDTHRSFLMSVHAHRAEAIAPIIAALPQSERYDKLKTDTVIELLKQAIRPYANANNFTQYAADIIVSLVATSPEKALALLHEISENQRFVPEYTAIAFDVNTMVLNVFSNAHNLLADKDSDQSPTPLAIDQSNVVDADTNI